MQEASSAEEDEQKLKALRAAIDKGFASGVAEGDPFERVLDRLKKRAAMNCIVHTRRRSLD